MEVENLLMLCNQVLGLRLEGLWLRLEVSQVESELSIAQGRLSMVLSSTHDSTQ